MEKHDVEVLGILLTFSKLWRRTRIQTVLNLKRSDNTEYIAVTNNLDEKATLTFPRIITAFEGLYEMQVKKVWIAETEQVKRRYYQFDEQVTPNHAFLPGDWLLWAERQ